MYYIECRKHLSRHETHDL